MATVNPVILAAGGANLAIAFAKFCAWGYTGSSAMLTEAIHALVDTGDQALLLLGERRGDKAPDVSHPFGYGLEVYFWSFVVALMIFALGGAVSIYEGLHKLKMASAGSRTRIKQYAAPVPPGRRRIRDLGHA